MRSLPRFGGRGLFAPIALAITATACAGAGQVDSTAAPDATAPTSTGTSSAPTTTTVEQMVIETAVPPGPVNDGSAFGVPVVDPGTCGDLGSEPDYGTYEITFVWRGFLLAGDPGDGTLRCVTPIENQDRIVWGPRADRLLIGTARLTPDAAYAGDVGDGARFTRPTGRNLVWVADGRLLEAALDGSDVRDISFLAEHRAVAYHPAGVEIASVGVDAVGVHGIWIARNDGTEPQRAVTATDATITEVTFAQRSGLRLYFIAQHADGTAHVHERSLSGGDRVAQAEEFETSIAIESSRSLSTLRSSPWTDEVAVTEGTCADPDGPLVRLAFGGEISPRLRSLQSEVIGWAPERELLVAVYPDGCDGPRQLWLTGTGVGTDAYLEPVLVAANAGIGAIRSPFPEPPPPLGEIDAGDSAG